MSGHKHSNCNWDGDVHSVSAGTLAVLQDIRTELQRLNYLLHCSNFLGIPGKLEAIRIATNRIPLRKKKRKVKP